jgi:hypothetical protein
VLAKLIPSLPGVSKKDLPIVLDAASTLLASKDALAASGGISGDTSNVGLDFYSRAFKQARERAETVAKGGGKPFELPPPPTVAFGETPAPAATTPPVTTPAAAPAAAGTVGYQNGRLVPQPPTVYTPLPPTAAPAAPPAAAASASPDLLDRASSWLGDKLYGTSPPAAAAAATAPPSVAPATTKVPTMRYSANGEPIFRSEAEHQRAVNKGWLLGVKGIWINGKHYTYQPDQPEGG